MKLTQAEAMFLHRRRKFWTQTAMAEFLGLTQPIISDYETGREPIPEELQVHVHLMMPLAPHEEATLLRRRLGLTLRDAAKRYGKSYETLLRYENGMRREDVVAAYRDWLREQQV